MEKNVILIEALKKEIESCSVCALGLAAKQAVDDVDEDLEDLSVRLHDVSVRLAGLIPPTTPTPTKAA